MDEIRCKRLPRFNFAFFAYVITLLFSHIVLSQSQHFPKPLDDPVLDKYRWCIGDARGGIYSSSLSDVTCSYVENPTDSSLHDVKCIWNGNPIVENTYQAALHISQINTNVSVNCSLVRNVKSTVYGEISDIQLNPNIGLRKLFRGPAEYMYWRSWLPHTSPLKIIIQSINEPLPSFRNYTELKSFSLFQSAEYYPKVPGIYEGQSGYALPLLPSSLEDLVLENNEMKNFPYPNNNTLPVLRRLSLARNKLSNGHLAKTELYMQLAPSLEELDFSYNAISAFIDSDFEPFPKLRILNIAHNRLVIYSQSPKFPTSLEHLNVSYNKEIDFQISKYNNGTYPQLKVLDISHTLIRGNKIIEFNSITPNLKHLVMSGFDKYHITNMNLDYLKMNVQDDTFPMITNSTIATLDFSNGKIRHLRNLGLNNTKVNKLNLSNNLISTWNNDTIFEIDPSTTWVHRVNFSYNQIRIMDRVMLRGLQTLLSIDLGGNPFECNNCTIEILQGWLLYHSRHVLNLNTRDPLLCAYPASMRYTPISDTTYFDNYCVDNTAVVAAVPAVIVAVFIAVQIFLIYRYRLQIIYMFHVYKLRVRGVQDNAEGCTHDVFVCYSSQDRPFVMDMLAPFLEERGPEYYKAYIHERSFTLGSDINTNIVEAIEKSRHALLVVSEAFLKSEYCKREFNMVTHRAFEGNPGYMVMVRYGSLRKEDIPRNLRMYMTTTTYLEWPHDNKDLEGLEVRKRLVKALGKSLCQRAADAAKNSQILQHKNPTNLDLTSDLTWKENSPKRMLHKEIINPTIKTNESAL